MANNPGAKKAIRKIERRTAVNKARRSRVRTFLRRFDEAVAAGVSAAGGVPAGVAYLVSQSWVWAAVVGAPLFLLVLIPSVAFVEGLFETYASTAWTLTYRDVASRTTATPAVQGA